MICAYLSYFIVFICEICGLTAVFRIIHVASSARKFDFEAVESAIRAAVLAAGARIMGEEIDRWQAEEREALLMHEISPPLLKSTYFWQRFVPNLKRP